MCYRGVLTSAINLMLYSHIIIQTRYLELKIQCLPVPTYKHNGKWTYSTIIAGLGPRFLKSGCNLQQMPEIVKSIVWLRHKQMWLVAVKYHHIEQATPKVFLSSSNPMGWTTRRSNDGGAYQSSCTAASSIFPGIALTAESISWHIWLGNVRNTIAREKPCKSQQW